MTHDGMWLFYCHLFGFTGNKRLNSTSTGLMGMRHIESGGDLENVLGEILSSLKTGSIESPVKLHIVDSSENHLPGRAADFGIEYHRIPLQNDAIPSTKGDRSFCNYISRLERFFKTLPVGHSTTPSCVECVIKKDKSCLKEYRFSFVDGANKYFSCTGFRGIDLKGICCGI